MRRTALLLGSLCAVASSAQAAPTGLPGEVKLLSGRDAAALCEELTGGERQERQEARAAVYTMTLPSSTFGFAAYETRRARLAIDSARGFRSPSGSYELMPYGLLGESAAGAPLGLEMAVPATAREAAALAKAKKSGELSLTLWFRVGGRAGEEPACATVHTREETGVRLVIEPIAFALARREHTIATGETEEFQKLLEVAAPTGNPKVVVRPPVLTGARGLAPESVARVATSLEPDLLACYALGLAADAGLRGALVLGVRVDDEGRVTEARPEVDGLGAQAVTRCVVSLVSAARFPRGGVARFSVPLQFTSGR